MYGLSMSRITLVTGGTRGIGYAIADALLKDGGAVAITGTTTDGVMQAEHKLAASVDDCGPNTPCPRAWTPPAASWVSSAPFAIPHRSKPRSARPSRVLAVSTRL